jgi:hypothetical protein
LLSHGPKPRVGPAIIKSFDVLLSLHSQKYVT